MASSNNNLLLQLLSSNVLSSVASSTGASNNDVQNVLTSVLPSLISGATQQNSNASTAASFLNALQSHGSKDETSVLSNLDLSDGSKIISHLLGTQTNTQVTKTAKETGVNNDVVKNIMSAVAPILMTYLGKQVIASLTTQPETTKKTSTKKTTTAKKTTAAKTSTKKTTAAKTSTKKTTKASTAKTTTKKSTKKEEPEDLLTAAASTILNNVDVAGILTSLLK